MRRKLLIVVLTLLASLTQEDVFAKDSSALEGVSPDPVSSILSSQTEDQNELPEEVMAAIKEVLSPWLNLDPASLLGYGCFRFVVICDMSEETGEVFYSPIDAVGYLPRSMQYAIPVSSAQAVQDILAANEQEYGFKNCYMLTEEVKCA